MIEIETVLTTVQKAQVWAARDPKFALGSAIKAGRCECGGRPAYFATFPTGTGKIAEFVCKGCEEQKHTYAAGWHDLGTNFHLPIPGGEMDLADDWLDQFETATKGMHNFDIARKANVAVSTIRHMRKGHPPSYMESRRLEQAFKIKLVVPVMVKPITISIANKPPEHTVWLENIVVFENKRKR